MTVDTVTELCRSALMITLMVSAPVLAVAVVVGLGISILQAVTQIHDQTISIIPKIVLMLLTLLYILPWGLSQLMAYSRALFDGVPQTML